jgi:hypothetical protein
MNSQRGKASTNASRQIKSKNQNRQASKSQTNASQPRKRKSQINSRRGGTDLTPTQTIVGAAVSSSSVPRGLGLVDIRKMELSWQAGYIYVGNGTLGATNGIYFLDPSSTYTLFPGIAVSGSDSLVGASYVNDLQKHFARKVIHKCFVEITSLNPSTSNSMVAYIAPYRGAGQTVNMVKQVDTTAANTLTNIISMTGARPFASWQSGVIDASSFISGGSGAAQNEFQINTTHNGNTTVYANNVDGVGLIPLSINCAGNNSTSGLQGTSTHIVVIRQIIDLLDFIGGQSAPDPE